MPSSSPPSSNGGEKTAVKNILLALQKCWFDSGDSEALRCAHLLKSALSEELSDNPYKTQPCSPPSGLCLNSNTEDFGLFQILFQCWNHLSWTISQRFNSQVEDGRIKEMVLIGPYGTFQNDKLSVKITWVKEDTFLPRHSEESAEMLQILEGDDIQIGLAVDDWLERRKYHYFPPTFPKVLKTASNMPFVAISVHTGNICGKWWLNDSEFNAGVKYQSVSDVKLNVEKYFDKVAPDYGKAMRAWGYCMPEFLSTALTEYGKVEPTRELKVLDLGCGDGALGDALKKKGFQNISGIDISSSMLEIAESKKCYTELRKGNVMDPLPYSKETFDCLVTSAVTTYLEPDALKSWLPIVKKGGIICIVHKASVWPLWVEEQERLECCKAWKLLWFSEESVPFLPSLDVKGTDRAKVYIYQRI